MAKQGRARLTRKGALLRMLIAFVVVMSAYNPSGYSYYHKMLEASWSPDLPWGMIITGVLYLSALILFWTYSKKILGKGGLFMVLLLAGVILAMGFSQGWVTTGGPLAWFLVVVVALIFTIGLTGGFLIRAVFGIIPTDDDEVDVAE